jgi:hypothetical protein
MSPLALFGISIGLSFIAWGIAAAWCLWPQLRQRSRGGPQPLFLLHSLQFVRLSFLVPGLVSPG